MCKFGKAWTGPCNEEGEPYCPEHDGVKCCSCGEQATHECAVTMTQFVCGYPLCDNCEHELTEAGDNGGWFNTKHCKKTEQKYTPWYTR